MKAITPALEVSVAAAIIPYSKLVDSLSEFNDTLLGSIKKVERIVSLFTAIEQTADQGISELGGLGREYSVTQSTELSQLQEEVEKALKSARENCASDDAARSSITSDRRGRTQTRT